MHSPLNRREELCPTPVHDGGHGLGPEPDLVPSHRGIVVGFADEASAKWRRRLRIQTGEDENGAAQCVTPHLPASDLVAYIILSWHAIDSCDGPVPGAPSLPCRPSAGRGQRAADLANE